MGRHRWVTPKGQVARLFAPFLLLGVANAQDASPAKPFTLERTQDGITFVTRHLDFRALGSVERPSAERAIVVRMDADVAPRERRTHLLLDGAHFWDPIGSPFLVIPDHELVLRVVVDERDLPGTLTVKAGESVLAPVELAMRDALYPGKKFLEYRYRPKEGEPQDVSVRFEGEVTAPNNRRTVGGLTVALPAASLTREVRFAVGVTKTIASFETSFGLFGVYRAATRRPALAVRTPVMTLGRNTKLSLDAVTVLSDADDLAIGGALTYSTLLGSRYYDSGRGVFGFPLKMNLTLGLEGLQVETGTQNRKLGSKAFFGFGFSIPTSEIKMGGG